MRRALRRIWLGCGYLPGYGAHPGNGAAVALILLGAVAGMGRGEGGVGALVGAVVMSLFVVPIYLLGAYSRGESYERMVDRLEGGGT